MSVSAIPRAPQVSFQPLSLGLAYPGFSKQCIRWEQQDNRSHEQDQQYSRPTRPPPPTFRIGKGQECTLAPPTLAPPTPWKRPAPSLVRSAFRESPPTRAPSLTWPLPSPPRAGLQPPQPRAL